ncbi:head-tail adaptor protein [Pelagibacterium sp. H642]|uniref:head-tail adaptor protein n=1 Tax=Pelagibacterium sp. H642 TaxID=1881069 RepID=UPI002815D2B0|nr:head-tail adaptor protein [Pelagibacterium sp. H642]WMT90988.1 head-tail adaptor protein [Pelagibacterium sp. H642]
MARQPATRAGALRELVRFEAKVPATDGWGQEIPGSGEWTEQFAPVNANLRPLRGSEAVIAARLQGEQPYIMTIRQHAAAAAITTAWRAVDMRAGSNAEGKPNRVFAIKAPPVDPDGKNAWLEILVSENAES